MIAVSLNVGGGVRLIKSAKHYKHNQDGRTAPGVCGNGSVPLSHSGNVVTRIGIHTLMSGHDHLNARTICDIDLLVMVVLSLKK